MEKILYLTFFLYLTCNADNTPVLIWSPSRSMSDLPQSYIGHKLDSGNFHSTYLEPLSADKDNNLVVFVQNKLSIEDFTNHADVYNPNSDGGVFKNVKSAMEEDFSVQLPSVSSPMSGIKKIEESYGGKVARVDNPEQLAKLDLAKDKGYLILVQLKPVTGVNEAKTFEENDQMMGQCMHHLTKRGIKYTAVYTAHSAVKRDAEKEDFKARRLLADGDKDFDKDMQFISDNNTMMSLRYAEISVSKPGEENKPAVFMTGNATRFSASTLNITTEIKHDNTTANGSMKVEMNLHNTDGKLTLRYYLGLNYANEWVSSMGNATYESKTNKSDYNFDKVPMDFQILAPKGFSFHCSSLIPSIKKKLFNNTNNLDITVTLYGFQLQAFSGNTSQVFTDFVSDCVPFFSIGIWMGIISTVILVMVLFFALTMVANITTMDRFDDPKGKPLTITLNE